MQVEKSKKIEKIFVFYLPFLASIACLFLFVFLPEHELFNSDQYRLISNIAFFNQTHILLTFFLLFSVGHYSRWRSTFKKGGVGFNWHLALVFGLFFLMVHVLLTDPFQLGLEQSRKFYFFLYQIIGTHHFLFQSFGFSAFLNNGSALSEMKDEAAKKMLSAQVHAEKSYLQFVYGAFVVILIADKYLDQGGFWYKSFLVAGVVLGLSGLIKIWQSIRSLQSQELRGKKQLFCVRYVLYPLKSISPWMGFATQMIHAWEYIYFVDHSFKNESNSRKLPWFQIVIFLSAQLVFIIPLLFMNSPSLLAFFNFEKAGVYFLIASLVNAAILCHFYVDRLAFSRKHNPQSHQLKKFDQISKDLFEK